MPHTLITIGRMESDRSDEKFVPLGKPGQQSVAIYARQSRIRENCFSSCEAQVSACNELVLIRGWLNPKIFMDEGQSSEKLDRPALKQLLASVEKHQIGVLVVYAIDRLTRRLADLCRLLELFERNKLKLIVVTDPHFDRNSPSSRLMTHIVGAASEFQQSLTRERMADSRRALKRQGKRVAGRVPFGYQADASTKQLIVHPEQAVVVESLFRLASEGIKPSEIAKLANQLGWKNQNRETGLWTARRISRLLENPTYIGEIRNGDATLPGEHEAIVSRSRFEAARNALSAGKAGVTKKSKRRGPSNPFGAQLLGILICGQCDRPMSTSVSQRGSIRYPYYRCRSQSGGRPPCPGVNIGVFDLEQLICVLIADEDNPDSEIPLGLRIVWRKLDQRRQQACLAEVVQRVVYDQADESISLALRDDWEPFAKSCLASTERSDVK